MKERDKKGRFIPNKAAFRDGEVVTTTPKHFSPKDITIVSNPSYTENRGWVYTENYVDLQNCRGGCGSSFEENLYRKITNPTLRLFAARIKLKTDIATYERKLRNDLETLKKIEYALFISVGNWDKVKKMCKCGTFFIRNSQNPNAAICDSCDPEQAKTP